MGSAYYIQAAFPEIFRSYSFVCIEHLTGNLFLSGKRADQDSRTPGAKQHVTEDNCWIIYAGH